MNCERTRMLLGAHLDRELDAVDDRELQEHLRECPRCLREVEQQQHMQKFVRSAAPYYRAPAGLESRVRASLRGATAAWKPPAGTTRWFASFGGGWQFAGALAALAAVLAVVWIGSAYNSRRGAADFLAEEIVNAHVRSLLGAHLTDVLSSDQHTVKPWFDGKVDFAPPVRDFSADGFPLVGGRLDYIAGHPAAALVFQRNKHYINVFIWPAGDGAVPGGSERTVRGYNILSWQQQDLVFSAISDLNKAELGLFVERFRGK